MVDTCCFQIKSILKQDFGRVKRTGFTLIELLMVMFIMGILIAIALPTYLGYSSRAKMSEALALAAPVRRGVDEVWATNGVLPKNNNEVGVAEPETFSTSIVGDITVVDDGVISIRLSDSAFLNDRLLLTPIINGSIIVWQCSSPDIRPSLLPKSCR